MASVQDIARDGYITDPSAIQAIVELASKHVTGVSFEDEAEPFAVTSSIDIVATATKESRVLLPRNALTYAICQRPDLMQSQITQLNQEPYNLTKVTMRGLCFKVSRQPGPIIVDVAFDLLYTVEWQTCIPGGACNLHLYDIYSRPTSR